MAKPIITLNGLKMVIMLGMLVIILTGIRFAADIIVPFILALFLAVIINPLVQLLVRCRVPRVLAISLLIGLIVMLAIVLLASLGNIDGGAGDLAQRAGAHPAAVSQLSL